MKTVQSDKAVELAACCWCTEETETIPMDVRLANAFVAVLDPLLSQVASLEGWQQAAAEANGKLDAYLREVDPSLPEQYGFPKDGLWLVVRKLQEQLALSYAPCKEAGCGAPPEGILGRDGRADRFAYFCSHPDCHRCHRYFAGEATLLPPAEARAAWNKANR